MIMWKVGEEKRRGRKLKSGLTEQQRETVLPGSRFTHVDIVWKNSRHRKVKTEQAG